MINWRAFIVGMLWGVLYSIAGIVCGEFHLGWYFLTVTCGAIFYHMTFEEQL